MQVKKIGGRWEARGAEGLTGRAHCWLRPDDRRFAAFTTGDAATVAALAAAVCADTGRPLHITADADDAETLKRLNTAGFVGERYEHRWSVPVAIAAGWSEESLSPFEVRSPEEVEPGELRRFDDVLRADIPGLRGWRWTPEGWAAEFESPAYDPELYPVLWDRAASRFAGLARVWSNPDGPRLGLVGAARPYRRRGIGAALLARVFRTLLERGATEVRTACDAANPASAALLEKAGGRIVGGAVQMVRWD